MNNRRIVSWLAVVTLALLTFVPQTGTRALAASPGPKTLTGTVPDVVTNGKAELRGHRTGSDTVSISVGLPLRNVDQLETFLKDVNDPSSSHYHQFLSQDQANTQFDPTSNDEARVVQWLKKNGLSVTNTFPNHLMVDAQGSVSAVESLFQVTLNQYRATIRGTQHDFFAPDRNPVIDASVSDVVENVVGLDSLPRISTGLSSNGSAHNTTPYYPQDIANAYDVGPLWSGGYTGTGQHIGITMWSVPPSDTTLQHFGSTTGAAVATVANGKLKVIKVCDGSNCSSAAADSGEAGLDIETTSGIAPGATIDYYQAPTDTSGNPTDAGLLNSLNQAGTDSNNNWEITNSWSMCEPTSTSDSFVSQAESIFSSNSATGHNYFFSSGDNGSWCNPSNGATGTDPYPDYPASSPHVTSVGGTKFKASINGSYPGEAAWAYTSGTTPEGSGGGYSAIFGRPSWQSGSGLAANGKRGYPDISAVADPNTGVYACYGASSSCAQFGGTSLSSPLWAGITALWNQYLTAQSQPHLGFLDSTLYGLATKTQQFSPFHDITSGTNGVYNAGTAWDAVTGWGAPDAWNVARDLAGTTGSTATPTPASTTTNTPTPTSSATAQGTPTSTPNATATSTATTVSGLALDAQYSSSNEPTTVSSGGTASFSVTLTNIGTTTWLAGGSNPFHLGIHFSTKGGGVAAMGSWVTDQRFTLPNDIAPGASATVNVTVNAPSSAGTYILEDNMVEEGVVWLPQYADSSVTVSGTAALSAGYTTSGQPASVPPGGTVTYAVTVTNAGSSTWTAGGTNPVHLGIHFATKGGGVAAAGSWVTDQRFALAADVAPGGSATFNVSLTAPSTTGNYILEEEMVKESVAWFPQYLDGSILVGTPVQSAQYTVSGAPVTMSPGGTATYSVSVSNTGNTVWSAGGATPVHLGVHFATKGGGVAAAGSWVTDQRWAMPADVAPGGSVTFNVTVTAPSTAGSYVLEEEMVQESVAWFSQYFDSNVTDGTASCPGSQSGCIQAMLNQLNSDRSAAGVAPLTLNSTETNGTSSCVGSYGHSVHMSQVGSISHDQFPGDICISYSTAGENVGESSSSNEWSDLQSLDNQMMAESHTASTCSTTNNHACNIINPAFHQVGIGIYYVNNTTWLTEDFTN